ncbi:glycosyltransferase [Roseitranquillus sediminis]|uniref:glycosyltransferase n=1 Tax=Roseitranquillus sediminis TaxID=2809051 RepID=UPI001D0C955A|nr:glycosyltransferase [Roseitranquillus sediminis]MBM9593921.1 glycosyltransferase [Roseitranquillus sediminis]
MSTPAVSVVLPAFNRVHAIRDAVDSVLRQTWTDFELLVVDDCSTDDTLAVVRAVDDPRVRVLSTPRNMGPSGARNVGIAEARGAWVAFQDSDDEWMPEKLARQMARLSETRETPWIAAYCGMIIVGGVMVNGPGRTKVRYFPGPEIEAVEGDILPTLLRTSLVSTQMLVVRRDELERIGGFDENLPALVDWDLVLRLAERGPFAFVDEPLVLQRFSSNSITRDQARRTLALEQIIEKHQPQLSRMPGLLAQQYRTLAGAHRRLGRVAEAHQAIEKARRVQPRDPTLWMRSAYLNFRMVTRRLFG